VAAVTGYVAMPHVLHLTERIVALIEGKHGDA
jgi:hypothetical protein